MKKFELALESLMKSLDAREGLEWPHSKDFSFLRDAVLFNEDGVISESKQLDVFPKEMFRKTLSLVDEVGTRCQIFSQREFLETVDGLDLSAEKPLVNEKVLVLKFNFNLYNDLLETLCKAFNVPSEELRDDPDVDAFYTRIFEDNAAAAFCQIEDHGESFSVFLINKGQCSLNIIMHEMIHFMQHVFGRGFIESKKLLKINLRNDTYGLVESSKLEKIFRRDELLPYIHNICYVFEDHGVKTVQEMLDVLGKFLEYDGEPEKYITRCQSLDEYKWFRSEETSIHMLMLSVIYGRSMRLFKMIMGKYFSSSNK